MIRFTKRLIKIRLLRNLDRKKLNEKQRNKFEIA